MGNTASYVIGICRRICDSIVGESRHDRQKIKSMTSEEDIVVTDKEWVIHTILQGDRFGKFVAEVRHPKKSSSYILKVYVNKHSNRSEHLVLSKISVKNPYLVLAHEWFCDDDRHYFIYDCEDVDFFTLLRQPKLLHLYRNSSHLLYFRQALLAVRFLHSHDLIHYDLKFENMVFNLRTKVLRLIDFECCTTWSAEKRRQGTKTYMAPEIYLIDTFESYDPGKQDIWCLALLVMILLFPNADLISSEVSTKEDYSNYLENIIPNKHFLWEGLKIEPSERVNIKQFISIYDKHVLSTAPFTKYRNRMSL